jgi:endonuclease YncB( thermonuclease family)
MTKTLDQNKQTKLLNDLQKIIITNKEQAKHALRQITINTYWQVGKRIAAENLSENANYKSTILQDLSNKLALERSVLARCLTFFETYPTPPQESVLTWSHYRELLSIKDENLRNDLEVEASEEGWTKDQLVAAIKNNKETSDEENTSKTKKKLTRPTDPTYLYKAKISNVVDGDTLVLLVDLGFQTFREQRVRLAGINCPEIDTAEGKKAKDFVLQKLAEVEFVMVKTHKIDIYGRYLGHIFYDASGKKDKGEIFVSGSYLNMEIFNEGLAVVMLF